MLSSGLSKGWREWQRLLSELLTDPLQNGKTAGSCESHRVRSRLLHSLTEWSSELYVM